MSYGEGVVNSALTSSEPNKDARIREATDFWKHAIKLNGWLSTAIVITTTGILISTNIYYLQVRYDGLSGIFVWSLVAITALIGAVIILLSFIVILRRTGRTLEKLKSSKTIDFSIGRLPGITYCAAAFAIVGTVYAGLLSQWDFWSSVQLIGSIILGLIVPGLINLGIAASVADPEVEVSSTTAGASPEQPSLANTGQTGAARP
ncbi:hypothetical protein [Mycobacterium gallinarum]|uniref:hypothetical protein n=1 Tax=Mycobacterium gallinarum TaxID=39689 RepID=UPI0013D2D419|nr:hypothetical protein [Mycobacterium gallinarum]